MNSRHIAFVCFVAVVSVAHSQPQRSPPIRFQKLVLSEEFHSEGAAVADINGDGDPDIVSGPFWYEGPEFRHRHAYAPVKDYSIKAYSDHFFSFTADFNGDGKVDIFSIPIPGQSAVWYQNPGTKNQLWTKHLALTGVGNESPTMADITGDGKDELICIQDGSYGYAQPADNPKLLWKFTPVSEKRGYGQFTHGLGIGDVDGDGRHDLVEKDGWWQQTETPGALFKFHAARFAQSGGSQMFVYDFDGDGDNDVLSTQNAHAYGLSWFERRGKGDDFLFVEHQIMTDRPTDNPYGLAISQMHAVALVDIDRDGIKDIVTGKRFYAHGGGDPGAHELPVLYWLRTARSRAGVKFVPHLIDVRVGVGTQLTTADVDGNSELDIVVGNKLGTFVLMNSGQVLWPPKPSSVARHTIGNKEFKEFIRTTDPLTPQQELETFVLPAGFEAQLVVAEPNIAKPMNMAFDAKGRMWVSSSWEYPIPAAEGEGRDTIKILEDTDGDGSADKTTTFADKLNIPIGLYPYGDGVICYSIPNIWYLRDTDGDGKCDKREVLYGPFDYSRDTHGMCNGFTRGFDGWLYGCHGFNNQSSVTGKDGNTVTMHSGNTFRMKLDGSRIEHFTHGQVNPFGMAIDPNGDLFTADCHTKPINMLMQGGFHESFGKPHDGLGFVPNVMEHLHGSTAIGGIAICNTDSFPAVYRGNAFAGNVMTSRVNRNSMQYVGATVQAREESDLLIAGDPWFRPVDFKFGPDGALYIADFYNRIIGHYEVGLDHPGRDRKRGRIWRVVFTGHDQRRDIENQPVADEFEKGTDKASRLIAQLKSTNFSVRMAAMDQLTDEIGRDAIDNIRGALKTTFDSNAKVHLLWSLFRLDAISDADLIAATQDSAGVVRNHAFRVIGELDDASAEVRDLLSKGLTDTDALVRRSAASASGKYPSVSLVSRLLKTLSETPSSDVHLRHAIRISLRDQLKDEALFRAAAANTSDGEKATLIDLCLAIKSDFAGEFLAEHIGSLKNLDAEKLADYLSFAARYASENRLQSIAKMAQTRFDTDDAFQETLIRSVRDGIQQRGSEIPDVVDQWATKLARRYLGMKTGSDSLPKVAQQLGWQNLPHPAVPDSGDAWTVSTKRNSADGQQASKLHSSFPKGESKAGIYRSDPFRLPAQFDFFLAGHDGQPGKPIQHLNLVRVRDAKTQAVLNRWSPLRNDTAQKISWETAEHADREVYVELVDGDTANAYAWLAVGRFSVDGLNPNRATANHAKAAKLIGDFRLNKLRQPVVQLLSDPQVGRETSTDFARALVALNPTSRLSAIAESISISGIDRQLQGELKNLLLDTNHAGIDETLGKAMKGATAAEQRQVAGKLAVDSEGVETLLVLVEAGHASARLLIDPSIAARLSSIATDAQSERLAGLVKDLPEENAILVKAMRDRKLSFVEKSGNAIAGAEVFAKQCGVCHQVAGKGKAVGPNLDGIGNRGLDRVIEDLMLPNRNIDNAFRASIVLTEDGQVLSGFVKPTDGAQTIIVDQAGKEITIATDEISQRKTVRTSPMPANLHETLDDTKTRDLLAYLLSLAH